MTVLPPPTPAPDDDTWFDAASHTLAAQVGQAAIDHALAGDVNLRVTDYDGNPYVAHVTMLDSVAGGGKTHLVTDAVAQALRADRRALVVTPGNDQVSELARRVHRQLNDDAAEVVVLHRSSGYRPDPELVTYASAHGITLTSNPDDAIAADVVVSTLHKVADVFSRGSDLGANHRPFGLAVVDESYQATAGVFAATAAICGQLLTVGDPGQLKPFSSDRHGTQWIGQDDNPLHSASSMLLARHGKTLESAGSRFRLPITRRLPAPALDLVANFYPDHSFSGWVRSGTRIVDTSLGIIEPPALHVRAALEHGWAHLNLPAAITDPIDMEIAETVARTGAAALTTPHMIASERTHGRWQVLSAERVGVLVTHNDQRLLVEHALNRLLPGSDRPVVGTANSLQGLEFDFTIIWYPLSGAAEFDGFRGDPARLAVMLTRHRHGCVLVGRSSDRAMFEDALPPLGAWDGTDDDPITSGWLLHRRILAGLAPYEHQITPAIA